MTVRINTLLLVSMMATMATGCTNSRALDDARPPAAAMDERAKLVA